MKKVREVGRMGETFKVKFPMKMGMGMGMPVG